MLQHFLHRQHLLITAFVWSFAFTLSSFGQIGNQVDEIVTDFNGYWRSGVGNINPVLPVNSHNLLAFTYDSVRYSTGVNDAVLTANGLTFTPRIYKAIGVSAVPGTLTSNTKLGLGALYDGVNPGPSNPAPSAALSYYLMDGPQGLNLGTGIANLPVGFLAFDVNNMQAGNIGDGIPDIVITQIASPSATADRYSFRNASGQLVGNEVSINLSALNVLGNWTADFYETTPGRVLTAGFTNTNRPLRLWATDLDAFGITAANIGSITTFRIQLSGQSDVAFVAYNASALSLVPEELPGGVAKQPSLWLKANNGPSTMTNLVPVLDWADKSGKANNASQSAAALRPVFLTQGLNYNPYVRFGAQYLNTFQNLTNGNGNPYSTFVVFQQENTTAKNILGSTGANCTTCVRQQLSNAAVNPAVFNGAANVFPNSPPAAGLLPWIWTSRYNGASGNTLFMNMQSSQTSTTVQTFTNRPTQIGSHSNATPTGSSLIAEVITYPEALTNNEVQRINSYLGIKYGISIGANYLSCNGSVIFESDGTGTGIVYDQRVTGIGRENCQQLYQRQSKSVHAGALITLGGGGIIAATNTANTAVLPDSCYLVTGDNNGAITWGSAPVGLPATERIARTWRARKRGNPGAVLVRIPSSASAQTTRLPALPAYAFPVMLVKTTNDDFSTGYTVVNMWQTGDDFETFYDFPDGSYFTFAYRTLVPLPVELLSFDVLPDAAARLVNLQWQTASEVNNAYFTIERSADNDTWSLLGTVTGAGNSNQPLQYTLQDVFPLNGVSYYRLSQTDFDGTTAVKGVRSVWFGGAGSLRLYPNPAEDYLFLEAENVERLELFDVSGKLCGVNAQQNQDRWTLSVGGLARGVYYLKIYRTDGVSETKKVILH